MLTKHDPGAVFPGSTSWSNNIVRLSQRDWAISVLPFWCSTRTCFSQR